MSDLWGQTYIIDGPESLRLVVRVLRLLPPKWKWAITIKRHYASRSLEQNARLHLLFGRVAAETGQDIEAVKAGYKAMFLAPTPVNLGNRWLMVYPSTSDMNVAQMAEFMERVEAHAAVEIGVTLDR
jgi:hypothetical protein